MHLDALVELAARRVSSSRNDQPAVTEPVAGRWLNQQHTARPSEPTLHEPVLCLILQGRKQVSIGDRTLVPGPGERLLVSRDLPVCSSITKAPYLALVLEVDIAAVRKLHDDVAESALDSTRARAASDR